MKTPVVRELVGALAQKGVSVGVIGHGYGGSSGAVRLVSDGERISATVRDVGDEAIELAEALNGTPIVVGKDRYEAGRLLEERFAPQILVADGAFQHLRLRRALDIVCVSDADLTEGVIPSGLLREPVANLRFADVALVDVTGEGNAEVSAMSLSRSIVGSDNVFRMRRGEFRFLEAGRWSSDVPPRVWVLAGVARPERIVSDLEGLGADVVGRSFFRDHHPFATSELSRVASDAQRMHADAVVTTGKDATRVAACGGWPDGSVPLRVMSSKVHIDALPTLVDRVSGLVPKR